MHTVPSQAVQAVKIIEGALSANLMGVYLYGSAILGGLRGSSDIDILALSHRGLTQAEREGLTRCLLDVSGRIGHQDSRPLEVTVVCYNDIAPWRFPPKCEYMYGEWLRERIEAGEIPQPSYHPDVAILLWQAREHSIPLKGPAAKEVIAPIPMQDIRNGIQLSLPELMADLRGDERNVLLTLARMWFTLSTGEIASKDRAGKWAALRLPPDIAPLLETAANAYAGAGVCKECWEEESAGTAALAAFMRQAIENLLARAN